MKVRHRFHGAPRMGDGLHNLNEPVAAIPREELDRSLRKMCRRIAAALIRTMAETDAGFDLIAAKTRHSEAKLRLWMRAMIDGRPPRNSLDMMSDFALAMECEIEFHIKRIEHLPAVESASPPSDEISDA